MPQIAVSVPLLLASRNRRWLGLPEGGPTCVPWWRDAVLLQFVCPSAIRGPWMWHEWSRRL